MTDQNNPFFNELKYEKYMKARHTFNEFSETQKYFFPMIMQECKSVLDVGCAAGGLYGALTEKYGTIQYTGVEYDSKLAAAARQLYPDAEFLSGDFMSQSLPPHSFDLTVAFGLLVMQPNYKDIIERMVKLSKRYVLLDVRLRYSGTTVVDIDRSYFYYHDSGQRIHYIVFNIYEFLNFLHIEILNLRRISVVGAYSPNVTSAFVPFPRQELIVAVFLLEKHPENHCPKRIGAHPNSHDRPWCELNFKLPDFDPSSI